MRMRIPERLRRRLLTWARRQHLHRRFYDFRIGTADDPYLLRWFVVRQGVHWRNLTERGDPRDEKDGHRLGCNVFLHEFHRSDDDRALHDHPWPWITVLLEGRYIEHLPANRRRPAGPTRMVLRRAGDVVVRAWAPRPHRVELVDRRPVTTLFLTGPKVREWGFYCTWGWRHWKEFTAPHDSGEIGRGCE